MLKEKPNKPQALSGFEHINRYWDPHIQWWAAKILPGEVYVTQNQNELICTTLGSCVSACIRDPINGIGGMNHFMLPCTGNEPSDCWQGFGNRYGNYAMETLINELMKAGADKNNFEMKVCGGGRIIQGMSDVGKQNSEFILEYAELENIKVICSDLGDIYPRKVMFFPQSGKLMIKHIHELHNDTIQHREQSYIDTIKSYDKTNQVELF
ncbi:MAG TPA: chemoreceptor glutamine deamidase CheD [Methylophaga aminisulfidivorans]|uniref:Chemoreceptor glutamine deamidase CheD n=2 Tax=root TaxID=1 RepID=A0A0F9P911_9ZZZZ|nr:chemoreceptor glutamine deamidase CheD [Methylophaga aminisulfidivorans]